MLEHDERQALLQRIERRARQRRARRLLRNGLAIGVVVILVGGVGALATGGRSKPAHVTTAVPATTTAPSGNASVEVTCPTPPGKYTQEQLEAIRDEVGAMVDRTYYSSYGIGADAVLVTLGPGEEPLAAQITNRFGDEVEITVGETPYCGKPGQSPPCRALPGSDEDLPPGLSLSLELDRTTIRATDVLQGTLTIRYDGPGRFQMDTGQPLVGIVVERGTHTVVADDAGNLAGTGYGPDLTAGQSMTIGVVIATTLCGGATGSALAPGTYGVRAGIGPNEGPPIYLAPEVPLTVTD